MDGMKTIAVRLEDGQDLLEAITKLAAEHHIGAGVILSGVGSLRKSMIRVPVIDGVVRYIEPQDLEIDALHGTVSSRGCHVHISVSDSTGAVMGGHVKAGCIVRTTCELVIGVLDDVTFDRRPDSTTGFDELVVEQR